MIELERILQAERQLTAFRTLLVDRLDAPPSMADVHQVVTELSIADLKISTDEVIARSATLKEALIFLSISVSGGTPVKGLFPDCVALKTGSGVFDCSGVMISDEFVVTANHCPKVSEVAFGDSLNLGASAVSTTSASVIASSTIYDVSIVKLTTPSTHPADPARGVVTAGCTLSKGDSVTVVGFGCDSTILSGFGTKRS